MKEEDAMLDSSEEYSEELLASSSEDFSEEFTFDDEPKKLSTTRKRKQDDFPASEPKVAMTLERQKALKSLANRELMMVLNRQEVTPSHFTDILYKGIRNEEERAYFAAVMLRSLARKEVFRIPDFESSPEFGLWKNAWITLGATGTTRVMVPRFYKIINAVGTYYEKEKGVSSYRSRVIQWKAIKGIMRMLGNVALKISPAKKIAMNYKGENYLSRHPESMIQLNDPLDRGVHYPLHPTSLTVSIPKRENSTVYKFKWLCFNFSKAGAYYFGFECGSFLRLTVNSARVLKGLYFVNPKENIAEYVSIKIPFSENLDNEKRMVTWTIEKTSGIMNRIHLQFNYSPRRALKAQQRDLFLSLLTELKFDSLSTTDVLPNDPDVAPVPEMRRQIHWSALLKPSLLLYLIILACIDRTRKSYLVKNMYRSEPPELEVVPSNIFFEVEKNTTRGRIYMESTRIFRNTELFNYVRKVVGYPATIYDRPISKDVIKSAKLIMKKQKDPTEILKGDTTPWDVIARKISKMHI